MGIRSAASVVVAVTATVVLVATPAAAGDRAVSYRPPVSASVVDPFRAPESAFGPGNRGLTYDLDPQTPVHAAAPGRVVFAGWVAGTQHVTVLHDDGLRTSYSFLETVLVRRGDVVEAGAVVGRGGPGFHFGVRDGDVYLDPASLFGTVEVRVSLVPHDEPAPPTAENLLRERIALTRTVRDQGLLRRVVDWGVGTTIRQVERAAGAVHAFRELDPTSVLSDGLRTWSERARQECSVASTVPPDRPAAGHVALLVAGYGSSSEAAAVDDVATGDLGYRSDDVLRFSYAGGRTPGSGTTGALASLDAAPYTPADTFTDLRAHGRALADLVEEVSAARPGAPIDLLAHSQGGVVVRLALAELERRRGLDALGTVVTIGTPHRGVDLGTGALLAGPLGHRALEPVTALTGGGVDADATSVFQMAETSTLVLGLRRDGVPDAVDFRTIGAAGDLVVTGDKTSVAGEPAAMVALAGPHAHDALPGADATTRELALALGGLPPGCRSTGEALVDAFMPEAISHAENAVITGLVAMMPG